MGIDDRVIIEVPEVSWSIKNNYPNEKCKMLETAEFNKYNIIIIIIHG